MRVSIQRLYGKAYGKYGIGAFNVFNAEQVHGIFRGAQKGKAPVMIQLTPAALDYLQPEMFKNIISSADKLYPDVVYTVHLDHGNYNHCISAIESGNYNSVMIDASDESFEENIRLTKEIVSLAHLYDIAVEAELGVIGGMEDCLSIDEKHTLYTDPKQASEFVEHTGCDSLAVAVGTSHGAYKLSGSQVIQFAVLTEINKLLPGFPLVLHGASAVPREEVERVNNAGGKINVEAKGIDEKELLRAIGLGVCKVNIATDIRLIWTRVHREFFRDTPDKFDIVVPGKNYMNELEKYVITKCKSLKSNNQALSYEQR
jgi:fructose-bisphosphate aldolase class II